MLTREELLHKEKLSLLLHMKNRKCTFHNRDTYSFPKKDAEVSTSLRKQGDELYIEFKNNVNKLPANAYVGAWDKYTESILYAPNDSEELALGYGNRSALMFYLRAFEECIVECDRAISITSSNCLKFKLLCRKAESLSYLDRPVKEVCDEALQLLDNLNLETKKKKNYVRQLHVLIASSNPMLVGTFTKKNYADVLLNFERSQEIACASKSVTIQYNEKWGRHIVATEDIPAGKIIAVEDFFSTRYDYVNYTCCNYCKKEIRLQNSLPCEHCVYNLYCSESCRKEAWDIYHQFQCYITPLLNLIQSVEGTSERDLKFILLAIHQVGGLEQMKNQLLEIENVDDPRMKGFSNGIFQDSKLINFFSLESCKEESFKKKTQFAYLENSCLCAYLLAKYTYFFGEKMNVLETEMFLNEDILFIAALFLRFNYIGYRNMNTYICGNYGKSEIIEHFAPFGSLFNHSCDPNVKGILFSKAAYVTRYPIQKGNQLFLAYDNNIFNRREKESRQRLLQEKRNFTCDCIACTENWSSICLPSLEYILEIVPSLQTAIPVGAIIKLSNSLPECRNWTEFNPKIVKKILCNLKLLSKKFTVHCEQYFVLLRCLDLFYGIAFSGVNHNDVCVCESIFKM